MPILCRRRACALYAEGTSILKEDGLDEKGTEKNPRMVRMLGDSSSYNRYSLLPGIPPSGVIEMSGNLSAALEYSNRRYSVIPIKGPAYAKGETEDEWKDDVKRSLIKWEEYKERIAPESEIKQWFKKWPKANVGIVTGIRSGLAVIDIDEPEKAKPILDTLIPDSLEIPVSQTPRGGQHLYFRCTDPKLSNNIKVVPGADLRANGGLIIAPPSVGANGKHYSWLPGLSIFEHEPPALPDTYVQYLLKHINNNSFSYKENCHGFCHASGSLFTKGRRDNDLFHVANHLAKSRMPVEEVYQILEKLALSCNPPFDLKEIPAKIESAIKRVAKRDINITEEVERWVSVTDGDFSVTDCYTALQTSTGVTNRDTVRQVLKRMKDAGAIEKVGSKDGIYRRIVNECENIDFLNAPSSEFEIKYPFGIEDYVITHPGNIIIVAGAPNSGKTAFLLNLVEMNMDRHDIVYFSSEMGAVELRDRLSKFKRPLTSWKVSAKERSSNFADVIRPDSINIIDYLEVHEDFWKVGGMIKQIFDKLKKGIAAIALQKNPGVSYGLGGARSLEKARLYLSMDNHKIRIEKGKNWANPGINPNGLDAEYKLVNGCEFIITKAWSKGK